jgi:hypothetical protein
MSFYKDHFRQKYPNGMLLETIMEPGEPNWLPETDRPTFCWDGRSLEVVTTKNPIHGHIKLPFCRQPYEFYLHARVAGVDEQALAEIAARQDLLTQYDAVIQKMVDNFGPNLVFAQGIRRELTGNPYQSVVPGEPAEGWFFESILSLSCIIYDTKH